MDNFPLRNPGSAASKSGGSCRVTIVVAFDILPQNFEKVLGTLPAIIAEYGFPIRK